MPLGYLENCWTHILEYVTTFDLQGSPLGMVDTQRNITGSISGSVSTRLWDKPEIDLAARGRGSRDNQRSYKHICHLIEMLPCLFFYISQEAWFLAANFEP